MTGVRWRLAGWVAAAALCSTAALAAPGAQAAQGPILIGAAQAGSPGVPQTQAVADLEGALGRRLALVRLYDVWDSTFPDATALSLRDSGHVLFLSVKAKRRDGSPVPYSAIAAARPGDPLHDDMLRWAASLKAYGGPVVFSFNHEPETTASSPSGGAADYVPAYRSFATVVRAAGAPGVRLAWTAAVRNFSTPVTSTKYAPAYYPGDAWVDDIAIDAYNMYCLNGSGHFSRPWRPLSQILEPWRLFTLGHPAAGLVVAEFASPEDPAVPGRKAQWISDAGALFQTPAYARVRAVSYWNQTSDLFTGCDLRVTSSASALAAYRAVVHDPYFAGTG